VRSDFLTILTTDSLGLDDFYFLQRLTYRILEIFKNFHGFFHFLFNKGGICVAFQIRIYSIIWFAKTFLGFFHGYVMVFSLIKNASYRLFCTIFSRVLFLTPSISNTSLTV
jgi:hypothetical protein